MLIKLKIYNLFYTIQITRGRRHSWDYSYTARQAWRGRSVLLSLFHHVTSTAARKGIVERSVISLIDASLAVDVVVADWMVVDHFRWKDVTEDVVIVFLFRSSMMSRSEFFRSYRNRIFHDNFRQRKLYKNSRKWRLGIFMKKCKMQRHLPGTNN